MPQIIALGSFKILLDAYYYVSIYLSINYYLIFIKY